MKFSILSVLIPSTAAIKGWVTQPAGQVWIDTRGAGRVQMGYLSAADEHDYPTIYDSGMPAITPEKCVAACDALGPNICAAAQIFLCVDEHITWCNLLTPREYSTASPVIVNTDEVVGQSFARPSKSKPKPAPALRA